jgi:hypothetical protein
MEILPKLKIARFEKLEPGDLFVYPHSNGPCLALKAEDRMRNGEKLILPLGPTFPHSAGGPRLLPWQAATTVSFGKDYIIRVPTAPEGWTDREPGPDVLCLVVTTDQIYFRANLSLQPGEFQSCLVRATDGIVIYHRDRANQEPVPQIFAYAVQWDIVVNDAAFPARTLIQYPAS